MKPGYPDTIYLFDMGGSIAWCESPSPEDDIDPDESVRYVKLPEGYAVVPVEPTEAMLVSGLEYMDGYPAHILREQLPLIYKAMLRAAEGERTLEESDLRKGASNVE